VKSSPQILQAGVGLAYAILSGQVRALTVPGSPVVLLDKDTKRRAEGILTRLVYTGAKAPQGIRQYDVYFKNASTVPYEPEKLSRFGVGVIC